MIDPDEQWFVDRLRDPVVSENDKSSCLDVLEILAPNRELLGKPPLDYAVPALASFIADPTQSRPLREQADKVARLINPKFPVTPRI
jgi:hypothetical protein